LKEGATINELCSSSIKIGQKRLQRSEGEVKNVVIIDNMETNYVVQRNGHKRRASRPSHKKKQTQMGYQQREKQGQGERGRLRMSNSMSGGVPRLGRVARSSLPSCNLLTSFSAKIQPSSKGVLCKKGKGAC